MSNYLIQSFNDTYSGYFHNYNLIFFITNLNEHFQSHLVNNAISGCDFCPEQFMNKPSKNAHVLEHFVTEICSRCEQTLIRIGDYLYVMHSKLTCIKPERELGERKELCFANEINPVNQLKYSSFHEIESKAEIIEDGKQLKSQLEGEKRHHTSAIKSVANKKATKGNGSMKNEKSGRGIEVSRSEFQTKTFECDICNQKIKTKNSLKKHQIRMHFFGTIFCKICTVKFASDDELIGHKVDCILRTRRRLIKCDYDGCKEFYKHRAAHYLARHSERQFECDICQAKFKSKLQINLHILSLHDPNGKHFKCDLCEKSFVKKSLVRRHQEQTHLKIRNFMCSVCGRAFLSKYHLNVHNYQHTGEKPYGNSFFY